jgi:hypothetical protein
MELTPTLWTVVTLVAAGVFCGWRGARPPNPLRGPRLIPWRALMVVSATGAMVFTVHLVNLLGVATGR